MTLRGGKEDHGVHKDDKLPSFPRKGVTMAFLRRLRDYISTDPNCNPHWSTEEVCDHLIKPWTEGAQCSFEEFMFSDHPVVRHPTLKMTHHEAFGDRATIFVSHAWKYEFVELVEAIETFFDDQISAGINTPSSTKESTTGPGSNKERAENSSGKGTDPITAATTAITIENSYLWIDLFLNNQWKAPLLPYEWWSETFLSVRTHTH
jgi:hypothetical protein